MKAASRRAWPPAFTTAFTNSSPKAYGKVSVSSSTGGTPAPPDRLRELCSTAARARSLSDNELR